jgi:hypothetical protein
MPTIAFVGPVLQRQMQRAPRGLSASQNDSQSVRVGLCVDVHRDALGIPVVPSG